MKTRIISGLTLICIMAAVLALGYLVNPLFITVLLAILASIATYELVHNVAKVNSKAINIIAMIYTAVAVINFALDGFQIGEFLITTYHVTVLYVIFAVFLTLKKHGQLDLGGILSICVMPFIMAYAFGSLEKIANFGAEYALEIGGISAATGIYYLLMMLNFSAGCDTGAYFVGVTMGKHKLCPNISPKKTIEGSIGGIVFCSISFVVFGIIIQLITEREANILFLALSGVIVSVVSQVGDLIMSVIKRHYGVKDYGKLFPGHGGMLDRFDSVLAVSLGMSAICMFASLLGINLL